MGFLTGISKRTGRSFPVIVASLLFSGCAELPSLTQKTEDAPAAAPVNADAAYYLQQLAQSHGKAKTNWRLLAIKALIKEKQYDAAAQQLQNLPALLSSAQQQEKYLLSAEYALATGHTADAAQALQGIKLAKLAPEQQRRYWQAKIGTLKSTPSLDLVRAYINQQPSLPADQRQQNIDDTWAALLQLPPETRRNIAINADETILQGWLDLLNVWYDQRDNLAQAIQEWRVRYPSCPAAQMLPTPLQQPVAQPNSAPAIAVLLPLSGQASGFAQAILKGFQDARQGQIPGANTVAAPVATETRGETAAVATTSAPALTTTAAASQVKIYDTTQKPLDQLMNQAVQEGATLIVGPLLKPNVRQLPSLNRSQQILALNQPEYIASAGNICYFALSPEDEARGAALHIWQEGKRLPLLLVPQSQYGERVARAFAEAWQQQGGDNVLKQSFGSANDLKQNLNRGIALTGTPLLNASTAPTPSSLTSPDGEVDGAAVVSPSAPETATAGSVDAVYIVATPKELALIKPMLDLRNGSRSGIALYASSRGFQSDSGPDFRLEMDGLQFSDIPLLTGANIPLLQQAKQAFNNDYSLIRLYAMGIDAWQLATRYAQLHSPSSFSLSGETGKLTTDASCVIRRQLNWMQYRQGNIVAVP